MNPNLFHRHAAIYRTNVLHHCHTWYQCTTVPTFYCHLVPTRWGLLHYQPCDMMQKSPQIQVERGVRCSSPASESMRGNKGWQTHKCVCVSGGGMAHVISGRTGIRLMAYRSGWLLVVFDQAFPVVFDQAFPVVFD